MGQNVLSGLELKDDSTHSDIRGTRYNLEAGIQMRYMHRVGGADGRHNKYLRPNRKAG